MTKKIVITGIGAFTPLATDAPGTWEALLRGESGARTLPAETTQKYEIDLPVKFAATVKESPSEILGRVQAKRLDPSSQYALIAGREAFADAGLEKGAIEPQRLLVDWATGIGGVWTLLDAWDTLRERGARRVLPLTVPMLMPNGPGAAIGMDLEARAGIRTVVSACASSTESVINAYDHLQTSSSPVVLRLRCTRCPSPRLPRCRRCRSVTTTRSTLRGRTTATATASCSARARPRSYSKPKSTRSPVERRSTPRSRAAA